MKKMAFHIIICFVFMMFSLALAADIPMMLNYQGYVEYDDGTPINDNGYFKFAIVDPNGNTTYWSNDGTSTTGDEPDNAVMIPVTNGVFTVKLGNTDMTNMSALPTTVFDQQNIYVRVWFSDDEETSFDLLSPDTQILSAGFAYKAQTVVEGGECSWSELTGIPSDIADGDDGITQEEDPTVLASVKDGISWSEITDIPSDFADGVDNVGTTGDISWSNLSGIPSGFADNVDNVGITNEEDPTVAASVKDGVSWSEIKDIPSGFADGVDHGIISESDPTVPASVKDGVSWSEISSIPAGFADGVDNGITSETDPQVGTLSTNGWCTSNGSQINCTSSSPTTDQSAVKQTGSVTWKIVPASLSTLQSLTVNPNASGNLLVMANGSISLTTTGTQSTYICIDLTTEANATPGCKPMGGSKSAYRSDLPSNFPALDDFQLSYSLSEVFTVTDGKSVTFYLNGYTTTGVTEAWLFHPTITAIFIPNTLP